MNAPSVRPTVRLLAIAFTIIGGLGMFAPAPALAQSARSAVVIPAAIGTIPTALEPDHEASRCIAIFTSTIAIPADSYARDSAEQSSSIDDPADDAGDAADNAIAGDLLSPGSGMVVVDRHGKIIAGENPPIPATERASTNCCPASVGPPWTVALSPRRAAVSYTPSNGSGARASCVEAMNPPPSSLSPL